MNQITPIVAQAINTAPGNRGVDGAAWLASEGNIALTFDDDVMLFEDCGDCTYEMHVLFKSRGRQAIERVKKAISTMFEQHGAEVLFGLVPDDRRDVKMLARWTGCKSAGKRRTSEGVCELFVQSNLMHYKDRN